jgi:hypothetical protein
MLRICVQTGSSWRSNLPAKTVSAGGDRKQSRKMVLFCRLLTELVMSGGIYLRFHRGYYRASLRNFKNAPAIFRTY